MSFFRITLLCPLFIFEAAAQDAELVWTQNNSAAHTILHSKLKGKQWQTPKVIYSSPNPISSPNISNLANGSSILIWSELKTSSTALMTRYKSDASGVWEAAKEVEGLGKENMASSFISDHSQQLWAVWSSNYGEDDDIYIAKIGAQGWSEPIQVNSDNTVPDILPTASLTQSGDIQVQWQSLDRQSLSYVNKSKVFSGDSGTEKTSSEEYDGFEPVDHQDLDLSDIELPDFLPENTRCQLYFPNNVLQQSILVQRPQALKVNQQTD